MGCFKAPNLCFIASFLFIELLTKLNLCEAQVVVKISGIDHALFVHDKRLNEKSDVRQEAIIRFKERNVVFREVPFVALNRVLCHLTCLGQGAHNAEVVDIFALRLQVITHFNF